LKIALSSSKNRNKTSLQVANRKPATQGTLISSLLYETLLKAFRGSGGEMRNFQNLEILVFLALAR
jgi:hypothetical protein